FAGGIPLRSGKSSTRPHFGNRRLHVVCRIRPASGSQPQYQRRAGGCRVFSEGDGHVARSNVCPLSLASRGRRELLEPLCAARAEALGSWQRIPAQRPVCLSGVSGEDRGRKKESLAAAGG